MASETTRTEVAEALWQADATKRSIAAPSITWSNLELADGYEIQMHNIQRRVADGAVVRGHKVGLTSKAMQDMLGVPEPDYGHLLDDMFVPDGGSVSMSRFCQPRAEMEMAFVLGAPLRGPGVTEADVVRATDHVLPAIEIVDSRVTDWKITIVDTIADNASSAALVLGTRPTRLADIDPAAIGATLSKDGEILEAGSTGAVLGNPVIAVAWLANKLAAFGISLELGHVIMPGACTRMVPVAAGDLVRADFEVLGHVSVVFA